MLLSGFFFQLEQYIRGREKIIRVLGAEPGGP
jgi:hypothetical protein